MRRRYFHGESRAERLGVDPESALKEEWVKEEWVKEEWVKEEWVKEEWVIGSTSEARRVGEDPLRGTDHEREEVAEGLGESGDQAEEGSFREDGGHMLLGYKTRETREELEISEIGHPVSVDLGPLSAGVDLIKE